MVARRRNADPGSLADAFEARRSDYQAAKASRYRRRRTGISTSGSGADYHYRSDADYLRILKNRRNPMARTLSHSTAKINAAGWNCNFCWPTVTVRAR